MEGHMIIHFVPLSVDPDSYCLCFPIKHMFFLSWHHSDLLNYSHLNNLYKYYSGEYISHDWFPFSNQSPCSIIVRHGLTPLLTSHPISSLVPSESDYVYPTAKAPLRPGEPKTESGKAFHTLLHLLDKFLIGIYYVCGNVKF